MKKIFAHYRESRYLPLLDWLAVIAGIVLFMLLVAPNLLGSSAYFDEGYSSYLAKFDPLTIATYTAMDVHPPLYYSLLHFWQGIVGVNIASLRMLSVILAGIAMLFGWLIVRRYFGRSAGFMALLLMALSPLFIRYGTALRMYSLALAIAFAGTYVLLRAVGSKDRKWWIIYAILVAAGMWTNYFMALVWVTHLLWLTYEYGRKSAVIKSWFRAFIISLVLYLPWLPMLLFRYGEIQVSGFWIKPLSLNTLTSTVTQSVLFKSATETVTWAMAALIVLVTVLTITGKMVYKNLPRDKKPAFRLILAMTALPVILLALASLPPLRPSYVYRYILVASVSSALLMAIIVTYARFKKHDTFRRAGLYALTIIMLGSGAFSAATAGNRNLDTNSQNMISVVIDDIHKSDFHAPIIVRSPYTYYVARLYQTPDYSVKFIYTSQLEKVGSTKPLYDHPEDSVANFNDIDKVWIVGEDRRSVVSPSGNWVKKDFYNEYDTETNKLVAAAAYYERVK